MGIHICSIPYGKILHHYSHLSGYSSFHCIAVGQGSPLVDLLSSISSGASSTSWQPFIRYFGAMVVLIHPFIKPSSRGGGGGGVQDHFVCHHTSSFLLGVLGGIW